ncbi:MAG: hypothetical protein OEZ01_13300, partial [Candidatus Heimdallarchaeota archaeon]|nr:hypothetical protein [Candidatus Heimdallarchaeota archaeon]
EITKLLVDIDIISNNLINWFTFLFIINALSLELSYNEAFREYALIFYNYTNRLNLVNFKMMFANTLSLTYSYKHEFTQSHRYLTICRDLALKNNYTRYYYVAQNNIASQLISLQRYEEALEILLPVKEKYFTHPTPRANIMETLLSLGRYEEVVSEYEEASDNKIEFITGNAIRFVLKSYLQAGNKEKAMKLLEVAENVTKKYNNYPNRVNALLCKAEIKMFDGNYGAALEEINETQTLLSTRFVEPIIDSMKLKFQIQLELAEIKSKKDPNAKNILHEVVDEFILFGDEQGNPMISIQGLRLKSELYIDLGNYQEAENNYRIAYKLAEKFEFEPMMKTINEDLAGLAEFKLLNKPKKSLFNSLKEKIKTLNSSGGGKYKQVEFEQLGILLLSKVGLPIFEYYISEKLQSDSALISGLITAISGFVNELVAGTGSLRSIIHEDLCLLLEPFEDFVTLGIVSKETFEARRRLKAFNQYAKISSAKYNLKEDTITIPNELFESLKTITENHYIL